MLCMITRLRRWTPTLFRPAPKRRPGQRGRTPLKGACFAELDCCAEEQEDDLLDERGRLSMVQCPAAPAARRHRHRTLVPVPGSRRLPIRWVLVRDPSGEHEPAAFLSTYLDAQPAHDPRLVRVALASGDHVQEVRAHLGVETQRQWSDLAILRTTPALLGLFSLITVCADGLARDATNVLRPNVAACTRKSEPETFSDAIAAVRRVYGHRRISLCPGSRVRPSQLLSAC